MMLYLPTTQPGKYIRRGTITTQCKTFRKEQAGEAEGSSELVIREHLWKQDKAVRPRKVS